MSTFYSDLIDEFFLKRINNLKVKKGFKNDTETCKILDFTFIFIDVENCNSVVVEENELKTKETEITNFSNIVVLLNTKTQNLWFWNKNYVFLGIFDNHLRESKVNFKSIALSSISFRDDYYHQRIIINSFDIVFINNPFENHIKNMVKPIRKAIKEVVPERLKRAIYCPLNEKDILNTFTFVEQTYYNYRIQQFNDLLKNIKELDESISNNLFKHNGVSNFNPEDFQ